MSFLLIILIAIPLLSGLILLAFGRMFAERTSLVGAWAASVTLVLSCLLAAKIFSNQPVDTSAGGIIPSILMEVNWIAGMPNSSSMDSEAAWKFALGLDGIGNLMVLLTTLVTAAILILATKVAPSADASARTDRGSYAGWILLAEAGLLTVFMAMDIVTFYVGFELTLIPLFVLIVGWGDSDALLAAKRFVIFTLVGSLPMIVALIGIVSLYTTASGSTISLTELSLRAADPGIVSNLPQQTWIFWLLVLGLGIKTAVLPLHSWLPTLYRSSDPMTTALMAAVVLKLGLFGFLRLMIPMLPGATSFFGPWVLGTLGVLAIVYGAMNALAQKDLRLLLAYSSLSHVGFITLGMFALNREGLVGAALQMFNHGITTAAMFLLLGMLVERRGDYDMTAGTNGIASDYPRLALFFFVFVLAGAGVPGLNNFVGEFLTLSGMVLRHPLLAIVGTIGIVLGAWYAIRMLQRLFMGPVQKSKGSRPTVSYDLGIREHIVFGTLALLSIWLGVYPQWMVATVQPDATRLASTCEIAIAHTVAKSESLTSVPLSSSFEQRPWNLD